MGKRFVVTQEQRGTDVLFKLLDSETSAQAWVWPGHGNNCVSLSLARTEGEGVAHLIRGLGKLEELRKTPTRYGTPILFPWPSRIPDGRYSFNGDDHQALELGPDGNAWHGLVRSRAWRVEKTTGSDDFAEIQCSISTQQYPELLDSFPFPHKLTVAHRLDHNGYKLYADVHNLGNSPMPFGIGFHPYFAVPFAGSGTRAESTVRATANAQWNWEAISKVHARSLPLSEIVPEQFRISNDLQASTQLGEMEFNHGLTDLQSCENEYIAELMDSSGARITVTSSSDFKTLVLYSPAERDEICLEPWTCTANVFNMCAAGYEHSGAIILGAGQQWNGYMRISLETPPNP